MAYVLRVIGLADGRHSPMDGALVRFSDVNAGQGRGAVTGTYDRAKAVQFATAAEAIAYWQAVSGVRPVRPDGQPNRPLTAYTVVVEPA